MYLGQVGIIDLRNSVWDENKSNRKKGDYVITKKVYVRDLYNTPMRPPWWFRWIRNEPTNRFREVRDAKIDGYTFVTLDDPYWPEGVTPDEAYEGHYTFGDVILMKRKLLDELRARIHTRKISDSQGMAKKQQFQESMRDQGAGLTTQDEDMLQQMEDELERAAKLG